MSTRTYYDPLHQSISLNSSIPDEKMVMELIDSSPFQRLRRIKELVPAYLRFVKGIVDTQDIDLNVSREMLQNNPAVAKISKSLVGKVLRELKKVSEKDRDKYKEIWNQYGPVLKEGLYEDMERKEALLELCRFSTNDGDEFISLNEYIDSMKDKQKDIYYISAETKTQALSRPHLEVF